MSEIKLTFGSPEHGWLSVELLGPGGEVSLDASDVPGDSLAMLAGVACNLVNGNGGGEVTWFLEPAEQVWSFRTVPPETASVRAGAALEQVALWVDRGRAGTMCIGTGAVRDVCLVIWRAFRRLEVDDAWKAAPDGRVWSHGFPRREVEHLGERLRADRR